MPARMRTAGAIAKQGKLDEARQLPAAGRRRQPRRARAAPGRRGAAAARRAAPSDAFNLLGDLAKQPEQPDLLYDLALTAEKLERFDLLETHLRKLIQLKPDHAHAYNALGYSFADRNTRLPEARS